ncbi:MAG: DUF4157 domain-containing protein [Draconibacterium sp.]|nr:DUF4157 domain-containing protein [Draconibacterium sp.]
MKHPVQKFKKTSNSNFKNESRNNSFFQKEDESTFFPKGIRADNENFFQTNQDGGEKKNKTGMPDNLKSSIENLSGVDMSDVNVHHNSSQPVQLDSLAYTQGTNIFIGPGQEKHLPHEAWHVVQQKQGRVNATSKMDDKYINDDVSLENEATKMGKEAVSANVLSAKTVTKKRVLHSKNIQRMGIVQRAPIPSGAIILDVNAATETVLQKLIATARATSRQYSTVNWRNMFLGVINQQITGRRLGTISHAWRDNDGLDASWTVTMSFDQTGARRTPRASERRNVTNSAGGSSTNSLGSSQSNTTGSSISATGGSNQSVGVEAGPVSASQGSSRSGTVGLNDSSTTGSSGASGGGMTSGASSASAEQINRFIANLRVNIDCTAEAAYSNWDIINPVKWGAHLAGRQHRNYTFNIGTLTYDLPNYNE